MALRWSKTIGAYNKYAHIFDKPLPVVIDCKSSISKASHVRDVIAFASENNLPGGDWYGKVKVSAEKNKVIISSRDETSGDMMDIPRNTVFDIIKMAEDNKISPGYKCYVDDLAESKRVLNAFNFDLVKLAPNIIQIVKVMEVESD